MTDNREQADKNATNNNGNAEDSRRREVAVSEITSLAYRSNTIHIGTSGDVYHFHGNVYVSGGGIKVKHATIKRKKMRENQRARRSTCMSDAEKEAMREAQHEEWQARQERRRKGNESRWQERDIKEERNLTKEEHSAKDLEEEREKADRKTTPPLTSFFRPVVNGTQSVDCSAIDAAGTLTEISTADANEEVEGKVNTKYLTKQNRQFGENHKWTEKQVEQIRKVVEEAKERWPDSCFAKAANILRNRYKGPVSGNISNKQVRNVYRQQVENSSVPRAPVGRPRKLSLQCIEALKVFARKTINERNYYPVCYFMHYFSIIIQNHGEAEHFANNCANPRKYLRNFIRAAGGSRRKVTKQGGKHLSIEQRKRYTDTFMLRLAYLVKRHGLKKEDVFTFDETVLRYNEDDGMVFGPTGAKHIETNPLDAKKSAKEYLAFIPMVSCSGDKLDPALIFKGTSGLTRSIPGYKDGFTKWNELYGEGKICFMQNRGKWTTNKTMKEWFTGYVIPRIKQDKQRRRDAGEEVSSKFVVILDGVSTHCLSRNNNEESWITSLQREDTKDEDLILLWLPPNTTGDLQPLDVNFNRPFKARYRDELYKIKLLSGQKDDTYVQELYECDGAEEDVVMGEDGTEFHLDLGSAMGDTRSETKVTREQEMAYKVKSRVIEALISAYKSISEDYITAAWKVSGKTVIEEFYKGKFQPGAQRSKGYDQAWEEQVQNIAQRTQENEGKLFFKNMSGGISDIELNLQFIPIAGRKKNGGQGAQEDVDMEEGQTTECPVEMSEYDTSECPDEGEDSSDDDDDEELVEGLNELALDE